MVTMYKNNSRFSSKFRGCSPLQLSCNLTGMKPAIGYYSYTNVSKNAKRAFVQENAYKYYHIGNFSVSLSAEL